MITRLLSIILLIAVVYILAIFVIPNIADQYGNQSWNEKIRTLKRTLESETGSASLYEKFKSTTDTYVSESKSTVEHIQNTVTNKTAEIKNAAESVQNAYNAIEEAKNNLGKLGSFSSGNSVSGTVSK